MYLSMSEQELRDLLKSERAKYIQTLEQYLEIKKWGFKQTYAGTALSSSWRVIYDSEWCRVLFTWNIEDKRDYPISHVYYGRLHAPSNEYTMMWNNEKCHCWHNIRLVLYFLDNVSPQDAQANREEKFKLPTAEENFRETSKGDDLSQPEWMARMHLAFWGQYGKNLFELFDLRRSDLWDKYIAFLKEYYELSNIPFMSYEPPMHKVC